MHFQIRNKEKYLLISMIWYLIIVSSALFLMFSPVQAWTVEDTYTLTSNGACGSFTGGCQNQDVYLANFSANAKLITKIEYTTTGYSNAGASSGTVTRKFTINGYDSGFADLYWSVDGSGAGKNLHTILTIINKTGTHWNDTGLLPLAFYHPSWDYYFYPYATSQTATERTSGYGVQSYQPGGSTFKGDYIVSTGSEVPDIPVINSVTSFPSCLEPGTGVVLESNVTGTVDDWTWEIYEPDNPVAVYTSLTPIETMVDPYILEPGYYDVQLTVENTGGSDFWQQDDFLHINQSGTCNFTMYDPFPTVNVTPTIQVYPTLTLPSIIDTNMTGINTKIDDLWILGNVSEGYREMVDYYGEGVNTTFTGLVGIIVSPFTFIANAVSTGSALFSTSISSLMSYTTIPLAIVGITLTYYPWQIITLITAGIAIDAVFVLIFGVR